MKKIKTMLLTITAITVMTQSVFAADIPVESYPDNATDESVAIAQNLIGGILDEVQNGLGYQPAWCKANNAVFAAEGGQLTRLTPDRAIALSQLAEELQGDPRPKLVVGDGAALCSGFLSEAGIPCRMAPAQLVMQNAVGVALAAEEMAARGETVSARDLVPVYLRLSQAERERLAKGLKITLD